MAITWTPTPKIALLIPSASPIDKRYKSASQEKITKPQIIAHFFPFELFLPKKNINPAQASDKTKATT